MKYHFSLFIWESLKNGTVTIRYYSFRGMKNDDCFSNTFLLQQNFTYLRLAFIYIYFVNNHSANTSILSRSFHKENCFLSISFQTQIWKQNTQCCHQIPQSWVGVAQMAGNSLVVTWNILIPCNYSKLEKN